MTAIDTVDRYFEAMQRGPEAAEELFALFADDAVYVEPFTGETRTHEGRAAIEHCFRESWKNAPPDMTLEVNRVDVDGDTVHSRWTCSSPAFDAPVKGHDRCVVDGGRIRRLEVTFE